MSNAMSKAEANALSVIYEVAGSQVALDLPFVKKYLVRGRADLVSDQEIVLFMNTCKNQGMNPLVNGEVYLIKYSKDDPAQIVVGKGTYLCKANFYTVEMRNRKNEQGQWEKYPYYVVDDQLPYGHGEKSVYIISGFMKLTREEAMAIRWHMGFSDTDFKGGGFSVGNAFGKFPLAVLTHIADLQATYLDEAEGE